MRTIRAAFVAGAIAVSTGMAGADTLPDGLYDCGMLSGGMLMGFGSVEIAGATFRGPAYDGEYGPAAPYEVGQEGVIMWDGPFGGLDSDGHKVVSSVFKGEDASGQPYFTVTVQTPRGTFHQIDCQRQP